MSGVPLSDMMNNYDELLERLKDIDLISQLGSLLGWD
tara:strand:+ start:23 stop:133 length:111 start_codon:yes stop_codon:yes gene_type:complete